MWSDGQGLSALTMSASTEERPRLHACFATTRWTIVAAARDAGSPENRAAWEELAKRYWRPVQAYIRGRCGDGAEADDLTQEFFARLIARDYLARVDPANAAAWRHCVPLAEPPPGADAGVRRHPLR